MPKCSLKNELIETICNDAIESIGNLDSELESAQIDHLLDVAFDDVCLILEYRYCNARTKVIKSKDWWENILPNCDDRIFRNELRVSRQHFHFILGVIAGNPVFTPNQLPIEQQLAITLSRFGEYGNGSCLLKKCAQFGVGEGTVQVCTSRVIEAIIETRNNWINWPDLAERREICEFMLDKLPDCIGYMDGTDIPLEEAPLDDHESYFSRKQRYALKMQAVVDNRRRFRDLHIGFPGSVHDARIWANSNLSQYPHLYFEPTQWIAADSAYPLSQHVITPYRKNTPNLTEIDRVKFQKQFSKYRVTVENAFGILKEMFGSLKEIRIRVSKAAGHKNACNWILACCIIYNMVLPDPEDYDFLLETPANDEEVSNGRFNNIAEEKRSRIFHWVLANF